MTWLILALGAHICFAIVALADRFLLVSKLPRPATYAALVGILGGVGLLVLSVFLGFPVPDGKTIFIAISSGALFVLSLVPYFIGLAKYEASRIVPATGALVPIFAFIFTAIPAGNLAFTSREIGALALLIFGSVLITYDPKNKMTRASLGTAALSSVLFAASFVVLKEAYQATGFWPGLLWRQIGGLITGILLAIVLPSVRTSLGEMIRGFFAARGGNIPGRATAGLAVIGNQALGAIAGLLESGAIYLAPVAYVPIVNATQGAQYVFLLVLTAGAARFWKKFPSEKMTGAILIQKSIAIALIGAGLVALAFINNLHA